VADRPAVKARKPARAKLQAALGGSLEMAIAVETMLDDVVETLPDAAFDALVAAEGAQTDATAAVDAAEAATTRADEAYDLAEGALTQAVADTLYEPLGGGGTSVLTGQVIVTTTGLLAYTQILAAAGVTATMAVVPSIAPHADADENHESLLSVASLTAQAGTGQITVNVTFNESTSGPVRINYLAV